MRHDAAVRYVIIGAGAVGGAVGARLHEAGEDVVLVARGAHLEALRRDGLRFVAPDGERTLPIAAVGGPDELELRPDDVLLLATKSQDTAAALAAWAPAPVGRTRTAGGLLPLVCVQNGVANERAALRQFANVYAACVWLPATHLAPGLIVAPGTPVTGVLHLGRYPEGADGTVRQLAERLAAAGIGAPVRDDAMRWKYGKLLGNLGNVLDALLPDDEAALALYERVRDEGRMVLGLAGIPVTSPEEERAERDGRARRRRSCRGTSAPAARPGRASSAACRSRPTTSTARSRCSGACTASRRRSTPRCSASPGAPCARAGGRAAAASPTSRPSWAEPGTPTARRVAGRRVVRECGCGVSSWRAPPRGASPSDGSQLQAARHPPVPLAEHLHAGRQEHAADDAWRRSARRRRGRRPSA